jgi:hypothetical protein
MVASLKLYHISSSEVDDLWNWKPQSLEDVFIAIDMEIGMSDTEGTNMFYVSLATPESLRKHEKGLLLVENRTMIVSEYNYQAILDGINKIIKKCNKRSWEESCLALSRYFLWEYEDYK